MGTKKQKMEISKAIAETIYSKVPPGRFLKKCSDGSGLWKELSKREAADKAAQAMAYIINAESLKLKRRERRRSLSLPLTQQPRQQDDVAVSSTQTADQSQLKPYATNNHLNDNDSSSVVARRLAAGGERVDSNKALSASAAGACGSAISLGGSKQYCGKVRQRDFLQFYLWLGVTRCWLGGTRVFPDCP